MIFQTFIERMRLLYIFLFLLFPLFLKAQDDSITIVNKRIWENTSLQAGYQKGYVFATNDFLRGTNIEATRINAFQTFFLKFSTQTNGDKLWQQLYKYPNWGFGVSVIDFHNPEEIGVPVAGYGFFNAPFRRWNKLTFNYEIGFGATFNWNAYNPVTNQYNVAIGAGTSFLIDAGLNLEYLLTHRLEMAAGFSFTHFSNGALRKPNFGINTFAPKVSLKYNFFDKPIFARQTVQKYIPENEWLISAFGGIKNVIFDSVSLPVLEKYEGLYFPVFGIACTFNRQVSHKSKIGFGATLSYNGALNAQAAVEENELKAVDGKFSDKILFSIYPSYELVINKASLIIQPAFYIYRKKLINESPVFHQRIGLKYHVTDHIFVGITLVSYQFHVSDFIEWNLGYRIKWN